MNDTQKYFIHLLKSHLNNTKPDAVESVDWRKIFELSVSHNVTGMLCLAIKQLPKENQPHKGMTYFNQIFGQTLQNYERKQSGYEYLCSLLTENKIKHLIVKGAQLRDYYPVPALRTSGDTDVIVEQSDLDTAGKLLLDSGFEKELVNNIQYVLKYNENEIELKSYLDHIAGLESNKYNGNFDNAESENGYTYFLTPTYHLYYVIAHMLSHIKHGGAGIRQLMDIHIMVSRCKIDFELLLDYCQSNNIFKSAVTLLSLSNEFFDTKLPFEPSIDESLYNHLCDIILDGGVFGYGNGNMGTVRLAKSGGDEAKLSPVKAFLGLFVVKKEYLYRTYKYARDWHILLPVAYLNRIFDAIFKRGKQNVSHIKSMFSDQDSAIKLSELIKELEI